MFPQVTDESGDEQSMCQHKPTVPNTGFFWPRCRAPEVFEEELPVIEEVADPGGAIIDPEEAQLAADLHWGDAVAARLAETSATTQTNTSIVEG